MIIIVALLAFITLVVVGGRAGLRAQQHGTPQPVVNPVSRPARTKKRLAIMSATTLLSFFLGMALIVTWIVSGFLITFNMPTGYCYFTATPIETATEGATLDSTITGDLYCHLSNNGVSTGTGSGIGDNNHRIPVRFTSRVADGTVFVASIPAFDSVAGATTTFPPNLVASQTRYNPDALTPPAWARIAGPIGGILVGGAIMLAVITIGYAAVTFSSAENRATRPPAPE